VSKYIRMKHLFQSEEVTHLSIFFLFLNQIKFIRFHLENISNNLPKERKRENSHGG